MRTPNSILPSLSFTQVWFCSSVEVCNRAEGYGQPLSPLLTSFHQVWTWRKGTRYYLLLLWSGCPQPTGILWVSQRFPPSETSHCWSADTSWLFSISFSPPGFQWITIQLGAIIPLSGPLGEGSFSRLQASSLIPPQTHVVHFWSTGNMHLAPAVMPPLTTMGCSLSSLALSPLLLQANLATASYIAHMLS